MKKGILLKMFCLLFCGQMAFAQEDFFIGLVDDNQGTPTTYYDRIKIAQDEGIELKYRYRYITGGVDTSTNWYSWDYIWNGSFPRGGQTVTHYAKMCEDINVRPSYTIYMLQNDGGATELLRNAKDKTFMNKYFWNIEFLAKNVKDKKAIIVVEPDTWGYLLHAKRKDPSVNEQALAYVNNHKEFPYLSNLPNTIAGMTQAILKIFRTYAPDAEVGFHMNHWAVFPEGCNGSKMVDFTEPCLEKSAIEVNQFYEDLFGGPNADKGNYVVVEKYGLDAFAPGTAGGSATWNWNDTQNANWVKWSAYVSQKTNMPLIGWQIPIGNSTLNNTKNSYKDSFMEYFFAHPKDFVNANIKGLLLGRGTEIGTDYSNVQGVGDNGWLFQQLKEFDKNRPYITITNTKEEIEKNAYIYPSIGTNKFIINTIVEDIHIYDALGNEQVFSRENQEITLDVPTGIYFVKIQTTENVITEKIQVER